MGQDLRIDAGASTAAIDRPLERRGERNPSSGMEGTERRISKLDWAIYLE
jgi:hypothetical protein